MIREVEMQSYVRLQSILCFLNRALQEFRINVLESKCEIIWSIWRPRTNLHQDTSVFDSHPASLLIVGPLMKSKLKTI